MTFYQWLHEYTTATGIVSVWHKTAEDLMSDRIVLVIMDEIGNIKVKKKIVIPEGMSDEMAIQAVKKIIDDMVKENDK